MFGKHNNGNNTATGNNANHTSKWRWLALLLLFFIFSCLIVIHVANYVYLRNAATNGIGLGNTGYSATTPIFENGIAEFVSLGFLILPLVLLIIIFSGWWDYRTAIVANVFAIIDVVVILFVLAGVITVHHMNNNNAFGGADYCNYVPQRAVLTTNITTVNVSTPIVDVNNTIIGYNFTIQNIVQNTTSFVDDKSGSDYINRHHYCKGQVTLLAGVCALFLGTLLTWFLSHLALNGAKRHANTTVYQTTQTAYAMQPIAAQYPAGAYTVPTTGAYTANTATTGIPAARSSATGNLNNV